MTDAEREQLDRFMRSEQNLKRTEMEFLDSLNDLDNLCLSPSIPFFPPLIFELTVNLLFAHMCCLISDDEDEENADSPNSKNSMVLPPLLPSLKSLSFALIVFL